MYVVGGITVNSFQDLINRKIPYYDKKVIFWYFTGMVSMLVCSIFVVTYFAILTCREYKRYKKEYI